MAVDRLNSYGPDKTPALAPPGALWAYTCTFFSRGLDPHCATFGHDKTSAPSLFVEESSTAPHAARAAPSCGWFSKRENSQNGETRFRFRKRNPPAGGGSFATGPLSQRSDWRERAGGPLLCSQSLREASPPCPCPTPPQAGASQPHSLAEGARTRAWRRPSGGPGLSFLPVGECEGPDRSGSQSRSPGRRGETGVRS